MIRIGGASGYWGESLMATPQLLGAGVDVLIYDYLAEITMSLLARARLKDPSKGYATDFVTGVIEPHLAALAKSGTKVIGNAGGVNPTACGDAIRQAIARAGLDLKVAVVSGDDLRPRAAAFAERGIEGVGGAPFPPHATVVSMNAYLGAFPIAEALTAGADIVITGRCVDSALTLGPLIAAFGWGRKDLDLLAAGSLVGHLIECGPQATGGNFTDWRRVSGREDIGYPIAEVAADGSAVITKPADTGGLVTRDTVAEQLVYEIGDPGAYVLPDVVCDFRGVTITDEGENRVRVGGARGLPPPDDLKVCATHLSGWRGGLTFTFYGHEAPEKAEEFARSVFARAERELERRGLPPFSARDQELIGAGSSFGEHRDAREVVLKIAVRHPEEAGIAVLLKETMGMGLATPPGLCGFAGGRPKPSPVVQLFSFVVPREEVGILIEIDGEEPEPHVETFPDFKAANPSETSPPELPENNQDLIEVPLVAAALARSGDKGDDANVGVIARHPDLYPFLCEQVTEEKVAELFAFALRGEVKRYLLPGISALNFHLEHALGGGGIASLRNDPQGKGFSQIMLALRVRVPASLIGEEWR
jgi:hypothetical protein